MSGVTFPQFQMFGVVLMVVLTDYAVVEEGTLELPLVERIKCFESYGDLILMIILDSNVRFSLRNVTLPVHLREMSSTSAVARFSQSGVIWALLRAFK